MKAYGIFQGGGMKGYAHVGALAAAEARKIEFDMVAGTSAGAIVASLVALGFTSTELYDPERPLGQRGVLDVDPFDIIGRDHAQELNFLMGDYQRLRVRFATKDVLLGRTRKIGNALMFWIRYRKIRESLMDGFGIVPTNGLESWLDGIYRQRLSLDRAVVFADFPKPLKVVTADAGHGNMEVLGGDGHHDLPVAKAVTASACFPFLFEPVELLDGLHIDGGLVSNLPVWIFDHERNQGKSFKPTFGFRLKSELLEPKQPAPDGFPSFLLQLIQTVQAGTRKLEQRRIDHYYPIDLEAQIDTLSLGGIQENAVSLIEEGRKCVDDYFLAKLGPRDPEHMKNVLRVVINALTERFGWQGLRVRASVLLSEPGASHARIAYSARMENDADDILRVRNDGYGVGAAFRLKEPVYVNLVAGSRADLGLDKYEFGTRPADICSFYSIPIFLDTNEWRIPVPADRVGPEACLVLDTSRDFASETADHDNQDILALTSLLVGEEIRSVRVLQSGQAGRSHSPESHNAQAFERVGGDDLCRVSRRKVRDMDMDDDMAKLATSLVRLSERHA